MSLYKLGFLTACCFSLLYLLVAYNRYVALRSKVRRAFFAIEAQLQRRYELIPQLALTLSELLGNHAEIGEALQAVLNSRDRAIAAAEGVNSQPANGRSMRRLIVAESALGSEIGLLLAIAEREGLSIDHPTLNQLAESLADAEYHVARMREDFDATVDQFNHFIDLFPQSLLRNVLRLPHAEHFNIELESARAPVYIAYT